MKSLWVVILGVLAAATVPGCRRDPEPIPGPKSAAGAASPHAPGIAWFQGSLEEGFSRTGQRKGSTPSSASCPAMRHPAPRRVTG